LLAYRILAKLDQPITSREIALKIAAELGEPEPDIRRLAHLTGAVNNLLRDKRGTLVQAIGEKPVRGKPLKWFPIPRDQVKLNRPTPRRPKRLEGRMPEDV
jgi:hypothetical protein